MIQMKTAPGEFYVFETWALAEAAQDSIYQSYVSAGFEDVNAATGERVEPQITTRWAEPLQRLDGMWVIPVPMTACNVTATIETWSSAWFASDSPETE